MIYLLLYLAAGGVVSFLFHFLSYHWKIHGEKHPEIADGGKDTFPWRIFFALYSAIIVLSVPLILPALCVYFDLKMITR